MTVDELQVLITANTNELRKEIGNANKSISGLQKSASKSTGGVMSAFSKLKTGIIALGIGKVIKDSIQLGMDAIESDSLFETVMGDNASAVKDWSNNIANTLGLSAVAMQKNIGVIYNMTSSMGVAGDNALKMSKGVSVLAEDMASFYNLDSTEAFNKIRAGLTGETEPLKALGILVDENTIKQYAYSEGIAQNGAELTNQQKVLARYVAILRQTGNAQGDLARTLNSPANQLRALKQNVANLGIAFSKILMPVVQAVLPWLNAIARVATQAVNSLASLLGLVDNKSGAGAETKKVSDNVGGIGAGLDDATKKAKKLKGSLAGFDEMNVLQDKSSDSGSGGGGAAGADLGYSLAEYDAHLEWANGATDGIVATIQEKLNQLGAGINWDKLKTAFTNLYKAVKPVVETIGTGLGWVFDNILVPLAQWTINDALPAFLNRLSGVFKMLNPVLQVFGTIFGYVWDNLLKPLAEWTGGAIVDYLNSTGDALGKIGDSIDPSKLDLTPITAFIDAVKSAGQWLLDFLTTTGTNILQKVSETWENIKGNIGNGIQNVLDTWTMFWTDIKAGIDEWGVPITEGFNKLFGSLWTDIVDPCLQQVSQVWADFTGILKEKWDEYGEPLVNKIGEFVTKVVALFQSIWDNVLEPIVTPFLKTLSDLWDQYLKPLIDTVVDFVMTFVDGALTIYNKFVLPIVTWITEKLKPVFEYIGKIISNVFGTIIAVVSSVITGVIGYFKGVIDFIVGVFTGNWEKAWNGIKSAFKSVFDGIVGIAKAVWGSIKGVFNATKDYFLGKWNSIKSIFKDVGTWFSNVFTKAWEGIKFAFSKVTGFFSGIWQTIKDTFSKVGSTIAGAISGAVKKAINAVLSTAVKIINGFISAINFAIGIINKIPGVEINKLSKLEVPQMARGGVVDRPTYAMIGEAGAEAVVPLERNLGYLDKLAGMLAEKIGGGNGNINLTVKLGEDTIFDKFIDYGRAKAFETNGEVAFA